VRRRLGQRQERNGERQRGDYGFQTTDNELQMNCNGTIRAVAMAVL